jgi:hypothetical protein
MDYFSRILLSPNYSHLITIQAESILSIHDTSTNDTSTNGTVVGTVDGTNDTTVVGTVDGTNDTVDGTNGTVDGIGNINTITITSNSNSNNDSMSSNSDNSNDGNSDSMSSSSSNTNDTITSIQTKDPIYSIDYFPIQTNESNCFLLSKKDFPLSLIDGVTKKHRFTYKTTNIFTNEAATPLTAKFNLNGSCIYAAFKGEYIQTFDIQGCSLGHLKLSDSKKSKQGLKGLVSSIDFNRDKSGLLSMTTFSGFVGLYDERTMEECMILDYSNGSNSPYLNTTHPKTIDGSGSIDSTIDYGTTNYSIKEMSIGITQGEFSICGNYFITAARKSNFIKIWDTRNTGECLYFLPRYGNTNQRIWFHIKDNLITTGDTNGCLLQYDTNGKGLVKRVANDVISCVQLSNDKLYYCTGQRTFKFPGYEPKVQNFVCSISTNRLQ